MYVKGSAHAFCANIHVLEFYTSFMFLLENKGRKPGIIIPYKSIIIIGVGYEKRSGEKNTQADKPLQKS